LGLVTLSANVKFVADDTWPLAMEKKTFSAFVSGVEKNSIKQLKRFNLLVTQGDNNSQEQLQWLSKEGAAATIDTKKLLDGLSILNEIDNTQGFHQIKIPSLFLFGEKDTLVPIKVVEQLAINNSLHQIHTLNNKGHCLHYLDGECQMFIQAFLEKMTCD